MWCWTQRQGMVLQHDASHAEKAVFVLQTPPGTPSLRDGVICRRPVA